MKTKKLYMNAQMKTVLCWLPPTGTFLLQTMLQLIVGHMKSTLTDFSLIAIALLQGICQALQKTALSCTQCTDDSEARVWIFCLVFWAFFYNNLVCDVYLQVNSTTLPWDKGFYIEMLFSVIYFNQQRLVEVCWFVWLQSKLKAHFGSSDEGKGIEKPTSITSLLYFL